MVSKFGVIYKIENLLNGKVYIGQSKNVNPILRWKDHYTSALYSTGRSKNGLYDDIRSMGIENFVFQILETKIPLKYLDKKEIEYTLKYNSIESGYNEAFGGQGKNKSTKLLKEDVYDIIDMLKQYISFEEIAKKYNVCTGTISDINCGDTWHFDEFDYPIMKSANNKANFDTKTILEIYKDLKLARTCAEVARMYKVSNTTMCRINNGDLYRQDGFEYPIHKK